VLSGHWDRYRRVKRLDPDAPHPSSFAAHLRTSWGFETYRDLLKHASRRALGLRPRNRSWRDRGGAVTFAVREHDFRREGKRGQ
jgi:hypothetical protein